MENKTVINIEMVIEYIEHHLDGKLDLETIAWILSLFQISSACMLTSTTGMTIHDYVHAVS